MAHVLAAAAAHISSFTLNLVLASRRASLLQKVAARLRQRERLEHAMG